MNSYKSGSRSRKHPKRSKVGPADEENVELDEKKTNNKTTGAMLLIQDAMKKRRPNLNAINMITNIKQGARRWKDYATTRRKQNKAESNKAGGDSANDRRGTGGRGLTHELKLNQTNIDNVDGVQLSESQRDMRNIHNRNLIEYFARIGSSLNEDTCVNLEYIESLLLNGASINCTDKYGQSVLHEASRAWDVDVARFLIEECEANINQPDDKGRTPLHVAAAVDYPEMVSYLIEAKANKEACTKGEAQTPVHFAARNDACLSLKALIKKGCLYKDVRDYKGRTPLHVAAELDRSETTRLLLELDEPAPAGVIDDSGQSAIVWMITKMPPVAKVALDQFHTTDRANRKQFYHLNWLEPRRPEDHRPVFPQTAMQVAVAYQRLDLIVHPIMQRLNDIKWKRYGRLHAALSTVLNLAFILMWTIQGMLVPYNKMYLYSMPSHWWRIVLFLIAFLLTIWQIKEELQEFFTSKRSHSHWRNWRKKEIQRDMEFVHPRWPEEAQYLQQELNELDSLGPQYFNDFWNIFDWICYALLLVCVITHIVDVANHTDFTARLHIRLLAITIILIWLRLMKNARAFSLIGPLIVIVGHMIGDCIKFLFLYFEFYLPFVCAFWMIFGGNKVPEKYQGLHDASNYTVQVGGMANFGALAFTLFRLTLVDEYDYDGMKSVDNAMTHILLITWFALSAILMLNLFIALLSDTFQRVYDNANANAVMQKAITILSIEDRLSKKRRQTFRKFIHEKCSPEKDFYDDDTTEIGGEDLKKVTFQIKDDLEDLREKLDDHILPSNLSGTQNNTDFEQELGDLQNSVGELIDQQEKLTVKVMQDMAQIKALLQQHIAMSAHTGQGIGVTPTITSGQVNPKSNLLSVPTTKPTAKRQKQGLDNRGLTLEIEGPSFGADLNNSQIMRHPPLARVVELDPPRSVMNFGEPSVYSGMPVIARQQLVSARPPPSDDDWDNIERTRRQDMKELRAKLSAQQQLASNRDTQGHASITTEDEAVQEGSHSYDESAHADTMVIGQAETSDTMGPTLPKV